ncbi:SAV_2336 N-terminal domain-related protein [Streptomyces scabiei]|uniref:SAV_2336 N-terminal domain-related protein n=1 Tax=Streptomyces scabiei TaxID=1930 RepID=UPI0036E68FEC
MLEQVRNILSGSGEELDAEELLDVLWLAARLPPAAATALAHAAVAGATAQTLGGPATGAAPHQPSGSPDDSHHNAAPVGPEHRPAPQSTLHAAPAAAHQQSASSDRPGIAVRTPGMKALGSAELRLGRSLRPLKHWRPDVLRTELDVEATVTAMAETGMPQAVLHPARTRWLDLAVLVDDGVSMLLWQRLAGEIRTLMERCGAFRHVRVHGLDSRSPDGPLLSQRPFCARTATLPMSTVLDPSGNTLLLVVSDGVGRAWRDGRMHAALFRSAAIGPTALLHVLPPRLRPGSGIGAEPWRVTTRRRGAANGSWHIEDPVLPPEVAPFDGVPVPLLGADSTSLGAWAHLIGSAGGTAVLPLLTPPDTGPATTAQQGTVHSGTARAEAAVLRFRESASPDAYRLAAHLAAVAPLPVPVMRLVQHAVSPAADTSHLAEVFLGGLMHGVDGSEDLPHQRKFDFTEETRKVLLGTVPPSDLVRTTRAVTKRLTQLAGSSAEFPAWLPHPQGPERVTASSRQPFAWVDETVMRRLGVSLPDTSEPAPPAPGPLREMPAGFELHPDTAGWQRLPVSDPRFDGSDSLPYEVFAEHVSGWSRIGLFLAHDGEGRILVIRQPEVPHARDLVAAEVAALKRMGRHAPRLLAWDIGRKRPWLAVECALDGSQPAPDLRAFAERHGLLHEAGLLTVARQCANGLASAHRKKLVHGSLTPHSVLIAGREVQIAGWMTATVDGLASRHRSRYRQGTSYRAPELLDGADPTQAGDIYALACILVEAATGLPPNEGLLEALNSPELPHGLANSLRACLTSDPDRRPTAQELLRLLNALVQEQPGQSQLTVTLGFDADGAPVQLDLASREGNSQGPHLLCQGRPASTRRGLLHHVLEQLTQLDRDRMEFILADYSGRSRLHRYTNHSTTTAFLGLRGAPTRALSLAEKINTEITDRQRLLDVATNFHDIRLLERACLTNPELPRLSRLIVAIDEVPQILQLVPEQRTALQRVAEAGGRLGIHLLLFADTTYQAWLDPRLSQQLQTRVRLLTQHDSKELARELPNGAVLFHASDSGAVHFSTAHGPDSERPPSAR